MTFCSMDDAATDEEKLATANKLLQEGYEYTKKGEFDTHLKTNNLFNYSSTKISRYRMISNNRRSRLFGIELFAFIHIHIDTFGI